MNDFIQMDIFFFITSVIALVFLILITVVSVYIFLFLKKINKIISEIKEIVTILRTEGIDSFRSVKTKINSMFENAGWVEKSIITGLGTIIAKSIKKRVKIKKDVPKK